VDSSNSPVESPTYSENWFLDEWADNEKHGFVNYILITGPRLRVGKTATALRIYELVETLLHSREPTIDDCVLTPLEYFERMPAVKEWTPIVGDEWNRVAGQRRWFTEANQEFAEMLQTTAYMHIHAMFPLPHESLVDNAIVGICSAQITVTSPGHAEVYSVKRNQLERSWKVQTPFLGSLELKMPSAKLWHDYEKKRDLYTRSRLKALSEKQREREDRALEIETAPKRDEILDLIRADKEAYRGNAHRISWLKIVSKHRIPMTRAQIIATTLNSEEAELRSQSSK